MADGTYQPKVYREQGGDRQVVASGGSADVESGGEIDIESGGLLKLSGVARAVALTFVPAAGAANVCDVVITAVDNAGDAVALAHPLLIWLSDDAQGEGLTGTGASGTVQAKSGGGTDHSVLTAKKEFHAISLATGIYTLEITDTAKTAFYVCAALFGGQAFGVSDVLATGDYGA